MAQIDDVRDEDQEAQAREEREKHERENFGLPFDW